MSRSGLRSLASVRLVRPFRGLTWRGLRVSARVRFAIGGYRRFARLLLVLGVVLIGSGAFVATALGSGGLSGSYVALGDSYSSGEGLAKQAPDYLDDAAGNSAKDGCHRAADAYPELVAENLGLSLAFAACSGAVTGAAADHTDRTRNYQNSVLNGVLSGTRRVERPQVDWLTSSTRYMSLTVGGDDLGFVNMIADCLSAQIKLGSVDSTRDDVFDSPAKCASDIKFAQGLLSGGEMRNARVATYETVLDKASAGRLVVLNYPQIFTHASTASFCPVTGGAHLPVPGAPTLYFGFPRSTIAQFNAIEADMNSTIATAEAQVAGDPKYAGQIVLVRLSRDTTGQTCDTKTMGSASVNGLRLAPGATVLGFAKCVYQEWSNCEPQNFVPATESFHPKASTHRLMASLVDTAFRSDSGGGGVPTGTWSGPTPIDPEHATAVSCAAPDFCAEVGQGPEWYTFNGSHWTARSIPNFLGGGTPAVTVSCPTRTFCAELDYWGAVRYYNGTTWGSVQNNRRGVGGPPGLDLVHLGIVLRSCRLEWRRVAIQRLILDGAGSGRSRQGPNGYFLRRLDLLRRS